MQHVDSDNNSSDYEGSFRMISQILIVLYDTEEILNFDSDEENKLLYLTKMGYSEAEASITMERCGPYSSIAELADFICATQIAKALEAYDDEPPSSDQKYVLDECRKWNLVWVGRNKVVPLEPDEMEMLLGFRLNPTRGGGSARDMFLGGINVLSLFSGISDAEIAFYCLGISLRCARTE
ncbi:DNA (Cytosine-5)-methyltransferase DRM1/2 isoform 2 [Hibiscus syriacus]|uniref:DNA (Cytosine-5)-methyltransferase DRM1/2 isoform 2 n=1 Tax=Hibiscus syriacus TaxID=106335 RepID=A0A6A3A935_HIBSY|nr:DNA (Cytosine-5)-methyltransferase DRM1/2 isoform 2 [Hibiscus syriacus]